MLVSGPEPGEGDQNQLPARFTIDSAGTIRHAHYGTGIFDMPGTNEMAETLKKI